MQLLSTILGHVMGVGVVAFLIVFQQEIRKFFMHIGTRYLSRIDKSFNKMFPFIKTDRSEIKIWSIVKACNTLSKEKTGAIIAIVRQSELYTVIDTGIKMNADISSQLIRTVFFKNSPLHDGALIIKNNKILAAGCILPVNEHTIKHENFGLRHRAALGLSEQTDSVIIVVSEETGELTLFYNAGYQKDISVTHLKSHLEFLFP
jgi:diadenylate cyclase